jgi:hypothetical protein
VAPDEERFFMRFVRPFLRIWITFKRIPLLIRKIAFWLFASVVWILWLKTCIADGPQSIFVPEQMVCIKANDRFCEKYETIPAHREYLDGGIVR